MSKLRDKYTKLENKVIKKITKLVEEIGVEAKHSSKKVLKVGEEAMFNLDNGYLIELNGEELIDNNGYTYSLGVIDLEQLIEAVDSVEK